MPSPKVLLSLDLINSGPVLCLFLFCLDDLALTSSSTVSAHHCRPWPQRSPRLCRPRASVRLFLSAAWVHTRPSALLRGPYLGPWKASGSATGRSSAFPPNLLAPSPSFMRPLPAPCRPRVSWSPGGQGQVTQASGHRGPPVTPWPSLWPSLQPAGVQKRWAGSEEM